VHFRDGLHEAQLAGVPYSDQIMPKPGSKAESLNFIGVYARFHETHGYYADPADEQTATLPKGWKGRLVNLPTGEWAMPEFTRSCDREVSHAARKRRARKRY